MTPSKELISVIIPCYREAGYIRACLESLVGQSYGLENLEIIVVDGMSRDGTREIVFKFQKNYPQIRLVDNVKQIAPAAMNIGLKEARSAYIVRIDAHAEVPPNYLERCMAVIKQTGADVVGGSIETRGKGFWGQLIAYVLSSLFGVGSSFRTLENASGYVDTLAFGLYKREVLESAGPHDEALVRGHDWEINQRIIKNGGRIYLDSGIHSIYYCGDNPIKLIIKSFKDGYWIAAIFEKHSFRHLVPFFFLLSLIGLAGLCYWRRHGLAGWFYVYFPLLAYVTFYFSIAFLYSLGMVRRSGWLALLVGPLLYASFHLSRGAGTFYGFLSGVWLKPER